MSFIDNAVEMTGAVVSRLKALFQKTYDIFYFRMTVWVSIVVSTQRSHAARMYHLVKKIKYRIVSVRYRVNVPVPVQHSQLGVGTTSTFALFPGTVEQSHETLKVLLDVDYSQYIHHIFTIWVLYFIFFSLIVLTTFSGSRALYMLCIRPFVVGPMHTFVRKYLFYNRLFIYNTSVRILDFSFVTTFKLLDKGLFEILGPYGAIKAISKKAHRVSAMQTGLLYHNTGILILGAIFLLMFGSVFLYAWMYTSL